MQMYWQCPTVFMTEGGSTIEQRWKTDRIWESNDDPVSRWHQIVTTYSGLKLTYENDRLPAIAAIAERELQWRKEDTYVAGMWTSSLLSDLLWYVHNASGSPLLPRLPNSIPTWSWPSSRDNIHWNSGSTVPSLRLLDLSFTRVGPAHIGEVTNASITLEGHICMTRLKQVLEPEVLYGDCMEMKRPPCEGNEVKKSCDTFMDFD